MTLPAFVFIGPLKTGTTWIYRFLSDRSDVCLPRIAKETFFFDRYFDKGLGWYESLFSSANARAVALEVAPSYAGNPEAARRLARVVPDAQIVMTVRNPTRRTVSQYLHEIRYGYYTAAIDEHLKPSDRIVTDSCYGWILETWLRSFSAEQISVLQYENLRLDPDAFVRSITSVLGLPPPATIEPASMPYVNQAREPRSARVSRLLTRAADGLRSAGLHRLASAAARSGLRKLIEAPTRPGMQDRLVADHGDRIAELLADDIRDFTSLLSRHPVLYRHDGSVKTIGWMTPPP